MASFSIEWKTSATADLKNLDRKLIPDILSEVGKLAENPFPVQCRKLQGSESVYRIRIGDYRVIYHVNTKNKSVTVYHIRHRREAYRRI